MELVGSRILTDASLFLNHIVTSPFDGLNGDWACSLHF